MGDRIRLYRNATRFYYFIKTGSVVPIKFLRTGFMLCQIGINTPIIALSAGTYVLLNTFNQSGINITLPSGKHVIFGYNYFGFIGRNSGAFTYKQYYGKFSRPDYMHRIIVRSCAKNPVDHPNGGRTRGKQLMKTP
jgi:large subunit ribosomal protein L2